MTYTAAMSSCFRHYFNFKGRAPRSEYWYWVLTMLVLNIAVGLFEDHLLGQPAASQGFVAKPLSLVFIAAFSLPGLSVQIRRLHDTGKSGWWTSLSVIPFVNFYLIYLCLKRGMNGPNQYGDDPIGGRSYSDRIVQIGSYDKRRPLEPFSDEELAHLLPERGAPAKTANARPSGRVPSISGKPAAGFGRRGREPSSGFRGA